MADIEDLKSVLHEFNKKYPRPNLPPLTVSSVYNIEKMYHEPYPNSDSPGVYIICHRNGTILRIGKASCGSTLTTRLNAYFKWNETGEHGIHKHVGYDHAKLIYTIGLPRARAFEVPSVEEYLIRELEIPYNRVGRKKL